MLDYKFIDEEFQYKSRIACVISTHSITNAHLFTQLGYDGLYLDGVSNKLFDYE